MKQLEQTIIKLKDKEYKGYTLYHENYEDTYNMNVLDIILTQDGIFCIIQSYQDELSVTCCDECIALNMDDVPDCNPKTCTICNKTSHTTEIVKQLLNKEQILNILNN